MNPYTATYDYIIEDDSSERAYYIWEAHRKLAMAQAEGNKKWASAMKQWLRRLDWDSKESSTDFRFVVPS